MYLRTTKRYNRDGSEVVYYQLAHNHRDPETKAIKADIIHNFGRADKLDRQELVRLCQSIAKVCGIQIEDPFEQDGESGIRAQGRALPADVKQIETYPLGVVHLAEALWERFDIGPTLRAISRDKKHKVEYERALFAMTANRLCEPETKLGVWDRWLESVYMPSCRGLKLAQMYEAMDVLEENASRVEEAVFFKAADLLNLEVDVIFYDTTTVSFSTDQPDEGEDGYRKYGRDKEGVWAPQVVVALAVTREGIPVRSWVFPGNTSDVTTVEQVRKDLRGWKLGRALFVGDAGMNSVKNRETLARACGTYLLAVRAGSIKEVQQKVIPRRGRYHRISDNLKAKEVVLGMGVKRRRYILCLNEAEARRQEKHREQVLRELEEELASHGNNSATAKWAIKLQASGRYGRYLKERGGKVVINKEAVRKAERMDGKWVVMTNDDTLNFEDAATGYKNLMVIERCFRSLKSTRIQMSPMHHWLPRRIEAHVKICVLALLIERVAELATGLPWPTIQRELKRIQVTEYRTKTHQFFERNELPSGASGILKKLEISPPKPLIGVARKA